MLLAVTLAWKTQRIYPMFSQPIESLKNLFERSLARFYQGQLNQRFQRSPKKGQSLPKHIPSFRQYL